MDMVERPDFVHRWSQRQLDAAIQRAIAMANAGVDAFYIGETFGQLMSPQLFADLVDVTFDMGRVFHEKLTDAEDFQPLHVPQCNIVAFRHIPDELRDAPPERLGKFQLDLRREIIQSGEFYIVPTKQNGIGALRTVIIKPLTTPEHLNALMKTLREKGRKLLAAQ